MIITRPDLHATIDANGAAILSSPRNEITLLDPMGAYIWKKLETGIDPEDLVHGLARETGYDVESIKNDVAEFLSDLRSRHLLVGLGV